MSPAGQQMPPALIWPEAQQSSGDPPTSTRPLPQQRPVNAPVPSSQCCPVAQQCPAEQISLDSVQSVLHVPKVEQCMSVVNGSRHTPLQMMFGARHGASAGASILAASG